MSLTSMEWTFVSQSTVYSFLSFVIEFTFDVKPGPDSQILIFDLYDKDKVGNDDRLGNKTLIIDDYAGIAREEHFQLSMPREYADTRCILNVKIHYDAPEYNERAAKLEAERKQKEEEERKQKEEAERKRKEEDERLRQLDEQLKQKESNLNQTQGDLTTKESTLNERERLLAEKEKILESREASIKAQEEEVVKRRGADASSAPPEEKKEEKAEAPIEILPVAPQTKTLKPWALVLIGYVLGLYSMYRLTR